MHLLPQTTRGVPHWLGPFGGEPIDDEDTPWRYRRRSNRMAVFAPLLWAFGVWLDGSVDPAGAVLQWSLRRDDRGRERVLSHRKRCKPALTGGLFRDTIFLPGLLEITPIVADLRSELASHYCSPNNASH